MKEQSSTPMDVDEAESQNYLPNDHLERVASAPANPYEEREMDTIRFTPGSHIERSRSESLIGPSFVSRFIDCSNQPAMNNSSIPQSPPPYEQSASNRAFAMRRDPLPPLYNGSDLPSDSSATHPTGNHSPRRQIEAQSRQPLEVDPNTSSAAGFMRYGWLKDYTGSPRPRAHIPEVGIHDRYPSPPAPPQYAPPSSQDMADLHGEVLRLINEIRVRQTVVETVRHPHNRPTQAGSPEMNTSSYSTHTHQPANHEDLRNDLNNSNDVSNQRRGFAGSGLVCPVHIRRRRQERRSIVPGGQQTDRASTAPPSASKELNDSRDWDVILLPPGPGNGYWKIRNPSGCPIRVGHKHAYLWGPPTNPDENRWHLLSNSNFQDSNGNGSSPRSSHAPEQPPPPAEDDNNDMDTNADSNDDNSTRANHPDEGQDSDHGPGDRSKEYMNQQSGSFEVSKSTTKERCEKRHDLTLSAHFSDLANCKQKLLHFTEEKPANVSALRGQILLLRRLHHLFRNPECARLDRSKLMRECRKRAIIRVAY